MRTEGVRGVAAVTLVTALLAGSGSGTASGLPRDDDRERAARAGDIGLRHLTEVLKSLSDAHDDTDARAGAGAGADARAGSASGAADIDRLAALRNPGDLPDHVHHAQFGSVQVKVGSGEVEIVSGGQRLFPFGRGDSSDPIVRHTEEATEEATGEHTGEATDGRTDGRTDGATDGRTGEPGAASAAVDGTTADESAFSSRKSILVRYDRFSPANAFIRPDAVTYDRSKVPAGAGIMVARTATDHSTSVRLQVRGLVPDRTYGAHVHTQPCGAKPDDSGPHYQHRKDPEQPSTDPRYANPHNEVWLDFTTDSRGRGEAVSRHHWTFREGEARSVVLHERGTSSEAGHAGQAGARVACFSVPLSVA
ncbi:superoxide dismutase family protein [Streptomyces spirodelae]|uniref:Superoxide dismutase family protein n=1 Tax=Streptomyces spirodelae TaxID=2812904 RepID=A0ABS3WN02_9ACTN|nr:superoxide dismutase family protein [Streptomyces spirodelae]MBO8184505.1 superoxide dismutase family protein [Streptomyces spirodelae]